MATSRNNELGYSTYAVGTVKPINECTKIMLYNTRQHAGTGYEVPTAYNLYNLYTLLDQAYSSSDDSEIIVLNKSEEDNCFYYTSGKLPYGFNVIIYISNSGSSPIGFTAFTRYQGVSRNMKLIINLQTTIERGEEIVITYEETLKDYRNTFFDNTGNELWNFTSSNKIKEDTRNIIPISRYTSHLTAFGRYKSNRNDYLINSLVRLEDNIIKLKKLDITRNIEADPYELGFTHYQVGYFGDNLAFYTWNSESYINESGKTIYRGRYCIISLTERNLFNRPIYYTPTNNASIEFDGFSADIDYFAGKYIVLKNREVYDINIIDNADHKLVSTDCFIDPFDSHSTQYIDHFKNNFTVTKPWDMYSMCPGLSNIFWNPNQVAQLRKYLYRKIGSWFILVKEDRIYLINSICRLIMTKEDYENLMIVNDRVVMFNYSTYYLLYQLDQGEYYTENAKKEFFGNVILDDSSYGISIYSTGDSTLDNLYISYYNNQKISKISKDYPLHETILNRFRKNYYNTGEQIIPNIICCCDGIIFYLTNTRKYLEYL